MSYGGSKYINVSLSSHNILSYERLVIFHLSMSSEYSVSLSIPFVEKLDSDACAENDDDSVSPLKLHLLTI